MLEQTAPSRKREASRSGAMSSRRYMSRASRKLVQPVRLTTRRGSMIFPASINGRGVPPVGMGFVPFFDEHYLINELTLDAFCPISKQPDYKKCAVKVEPA